ncbi:thymidylate synthase [Candidatus Roizmanbacteria bacterium RIFOXYB2_FULL_41_10]|uniref:Thymidylate synthase n=1 Tax=Candidatus Roizmanbacteria bacterium RIFOXYA1_FULL_41_12 TaxID=1802082 RepID=A0A1F7KAQ2_9BACT|nr:MAG: thymidylate synthase [Candidatus Roizmanbacteria bacterium RIFOXYA1_FULL_41_12]OGK66797.1 MAG: thymidylate synthase [Candidatus Roizmanbacteria bacterium RIFOXYB1_FULL_41_27]OGK70829.1 MAG: thymidylate synthase [Candidatus Roizmanbacteria bacterium RIFOXYC1_FULL_41_16]OGK71380.1 MAG: thymidylate synthase [Candidatus Roizmanbacteria bacterium RIFOXYB2_FULL_41_10]OGK75592.1 MAG: thymidylate synthase [Candidatus Roizmanbacteria bacterium RIFOXYD1_FULL_41_24]
MTINKTHPEYQYLNLLQEILDHGFRKVDRGTGDASFSLFGKQMRFDLAKGFPLLTTKRVYWKGVLYELFWFMKGLTNIKYLLDHNVHIWDDYPYKIYLAKNPKIKLSKEEFVAKLVVDKRFGDKWGELPRIYGQMWRAWPTKSGQPIDQLKWAIREITEDSSCHNAIVTSWNPEYLYTMATPENTSYFPICHNLYQLNVIDNKVSLHLYQRSADLFLGVPFNIASYALLAHLIAQVTGYEVGELVHTFGDVHIYEMHLDQVKEQLKRQPKSLPKIKIHNQTKDIDKLEPEDVELINYQPHEPIRAKLSVSGGYFAKKK